MGRLIDADALAELLKREAEHHEADGLLERSYGVLDAYMDVLQAPTVHPEQSKIGEWIKNSNKYTCPFCGTGFTTASEEVRSAHKYCYYCGAKMEVSSDGKYNGSNSSESS